MSRRSEIKERVHFFCGFKKVVKPITYNDLTLRFESKLNFNEAWKT